MIQFSGTTNYIFQNDRAAESRERFKTKTEHHSHRGAGIYWRAVVLELHHFFFQLEPKHATPQNAYPDIM